MEAVEALRMAKGNRVLALLVGPAAIVAAGTMGAGTTSSLVLAGAWFHYDLLWVVLLAMPLFVVTVDSASRVGLFNPNVGTFSLIRDRLHPGIAWFVFVALLPLHLLVSMSHVSVMTASILLLLGLDPPTSSSTAEHVAQYRTGELALTAIVMLAVLWLVSSGGYRRLQKVMTVCVLIMVGCFFVVCLRGLTEVSAILKGLIPSLPASVSTSTPGVMRASVLSIIAIVGSVLAAAGMLGVAYMSSDDKRGPEDLKRSLHQAILNLGVLVGAYSVFILIAGAHTLYPLDNHADIDTVYEASVVLQRTFPPDLGVLGTVVFVVGLLVAALTTYVVIAQVMTYFTLDMLQRPWRQTSDNKPFKWSIAAWIIVPALLAPFWAMPELLKLVLLMGLNTVVVPLAIMVVIVLVNSRRLMGAAKASIARNVLLGAALCVAVLLSVLQWRPLLEAIIP